MCVVSKQLSNNMPDRLSALLARAWAHRVQFLRYTITGVSAVALDIGTLYALKEWLHLDPTVATAINQVFLANYVFLINKKWSFQAAGRTHRQVMRFYVLAAANYCISVSWMHFFSTVFGDHWYLLIRLSNIALATAWNFLLYKYWVYRH